MSPAQGHRAVHWTRTSLRLRWLLRRLTPQRLAICTVVTAIVAACTEPTEVWAPAQFADGLALSDGALDTADPPDTATPETAVLPEGCIHDNQCAAFGMVCEQATHTCVGCLTDQHCPLPQFCLEKECIDDVCKPGETRCYGTGQVSMCAANGGSWLPSLCPPTTSCQDGACRPLPCKPGAVRCDGTVIQRCRDDGSGEDPEEDCAKTDRICSGGVCKPKVCKKGDVICADVDTALLCENPNQGWSAKECNDADPCTFNLCEAGTGCKFPPKADGMACGHSEWCLKGQCTSITNNLMVMFDTSGSMNFKVPGKYCYDQSWPICAQPNKACDRMGVSKNTFIKAFALVDPKRTRLSLFRFPQIWLSPGEATPPKPPYWKPPIACANGNYIGYGTMTGHTVEESVSLQTGWYWDHLDEVLCVPFPSGANENPTNQILSWMDAKEEWGVEPELRSVGGTPIGRTLFYIGEYIRNKVVIDGAACKIDADCQNPNYRCDAGACRDPARACRQTTVVVFTDGGEINHPDKFFSPWVQAKRLAYGLRCQSNADCVGGAVCVCPPSQPGCAASVRECLPPSLDTGYYCRTTMASCIPAATAGSPGYCAKVNGQNQCVEDPIVGIAAKSNDPENNVLRSLDGKPLGVTVHVVDISDDPVGIENSGNLARAGGGLLLAPKGADEDAFLASLVKAFAVQAKPSCGVSVLPCGAGGVSASCDDGTPCTDDACNQTTGTCSHTINIAPCDDGSACTLSDRCLDGECRPGIAWTETAAGNGLSKASLGPALTAGLPQPRSVRELDDGSVVISDGNRLVQLRPGAASAAAAGKLLAFAGSTEPGVQDGAPTSARFLLPAGLTLLRAPPVGSAAIGKAIAVLVADTGNRRLRSVALESTSDGQVAGAVTTLAGSVTGFADGPAASAQFAEPVDLVVDHDGTLLVVDRANQRLRRVVGEEVATLCGDGVVGDADGPLATARLAFPSAVDVGAPGTIFVAERYRVRRIKGGALLTVVGSAPGFADGVGAKGRFDEIGGIAARGDGGLVVSDRGNQRLRLVSPDFAVTTLSGSKSGHADGFAGSALFWGPLDIDIGGGGRLWVADHDNHRLRKIQLPQVFCPDGGPCNTGTCNAGTGQCQAAPKPDGSPCDLSACLQDETCQGLVCQNGTPLDCGDGEACTADSCDPSSGLCGHVHVGGPCDDGSACTGGDVCGSGHCQGKALNCDDGDAITLDLCEAGVCLHRVGKCTKDAECHDGESACTLDRCVAGQCQFQATGKAGCCQPEVLVASFDGGALGGIQVTSSLGPGKGFHPVTRDVGADLGLQVLWYGDDSKDNYDLISGKGHKGSVLKAKLALPPGRPARARFRMWLDIERATLYDSLRLTATASGVETLLWHKYPKTKMKQWVEVEVGLDAFAGRVLDLELRFDTVDGLANTGQGILIDWVRVEADCGK